MVFDIVEEIVSLILSGKFMMIFVERDRNLFYIGLAIVLVPICKADDEFSPPRP